MSDIIKMLAKQLGGPNYRPPVAPKPSARNGLIVAGHESPHKFDQYSLDHMGTGEGAQSYSKGIYFWEEPSVGRHYNQKFETPGWEQDTFFKPPDDMLHGYHAEGDFADVLPHLEKLYRDGVIPRSVIEARNRGDISTAGQELERWAKSEWGQPYKKLNYSDDPEGVMNAIMELAGMGEEPLSRQHLAKGAAAMINPPGGIKPSPGFTYHSNIHADRNTLPIYSQSMRRQYPEVQDALLDITSQNKDLFWGDISPRTLRVSARNQFEATATPEDLRVKMQNKKVPVSGNNHPALGTFESALLDRGIPGIRYDDGLSRSATTKGNGTQNFVIYDPGVVDIVKRYPYALAAPIAAGAASSQRSRQNAETR